MKELNSGLLAPEGYEPVGDRSNGNHNLRESLREIEQQLLTDDRQWVRLTGYYEERDFSQLARKHIDALVYSFWLKNPLIARAVETENNYVFGRGVNVSAKDESVQALLKEMWNEPTNQAELTGLQGQYMANSELKLFGNVFLGLFTDTTTGKVDIRSFPQSEITDIIYDEDDRRRPLYYKWEYREERYNFSEDRREQGDWKTDYIADLRYPEENPPNATRDDVRILHVWTNKLRDGKWGNSEIYRAVDWAKAYTQFLEDWATLVAALSKFAFKLKSKGSASDAAKEFSQQMGGSDAPPAGGIWAEREGAAELKPMPQGGPSVAADDGRRFLLMVAAGTGIWEHYFGDPSTGNLATSTAMELPMLKGFEARQQLWQDVLEEICDYQIKQSAAAPQGVLNNQVSYDTDELGRTRLVIDGEPPEFEVTFPSIVEKDVPKLVQSINQAAQTGTIPTREAARLVMTHLGVENVDEHLDEIEDVTDEEGEADPDQFTEALEALLEHLEDIDEQ